MTNQNLLDLQSMEQLPESHAWLPLDHSPSYGPVNPNPIPLINLKNPNAMKLVGHACQTFGMFQVINHGVPTNLVEEMEDASRQLFALPIHQKLQAARAPNGVSGYGVARISSFFPKHMWSEGFTIVGSPNEHARKLWPGSYSKFW
ncbi:hypothetical protein SSX86_021172 [Deinandra increscens subsp. villosa]|uniref:Non-haem dioxygenase N-terminal domain-containing protein n=1 Tax=Deinandra increscens subsp. villosa TaxID=3103831 RepID=A0AAP0CTT1_9ASTR